MLCATLLASCQTTGTDEIDVSVEVYCGVSRPIYWSKNDTPETVQQVKESNAAHKALCGG